MKITSNRTDSVKNAVITSIEEVTEKALRVKFANGKHMLWPHPDNYDYPREIDEGDKVTASWKDGKFIIS